jgi:pimeloyl-ACP methyl ester carboxylesterase
MMTVENGTSIGSAADLSCHRRHPTLPPAIETPVLIINGARDPVVPPVNAEYLHKRLPKTRLKIIDAGHFIWEDAADVYESWSRDGGPEVMRKSTPAPNSLSSSGT